MVRGRTLAVFALVGAELAAAASATAAPGKLYTLAATQSCLTRLPTAVTGLPPVRPPVPPALFVYALAHDDVSTWGIGDGRQRAHTQLGIWYGGHDYEGIILSFFKSGPDARASSKSLARPYGGRLIGNVVVTWDQKPMPSRGMRNLVVGCLRSTAIGGAAPTRPSRPASLATFTGFWGGHTRGLSITSTGRGRESTDSGCCTREYRLAFQILSVRGTLTRAVALYRVTSFQRYDRAVRRLHVGDSGKLVLRNGIVTNTLTRVYFCSDPAWGATGACGA